jgi:hypothetical protein
MNPNNLNLIEEDLNDSTDHEIEITGLSPSSKYYYSIGTTTAPLSGGDSSYFFVTSPIPGTSKPTRIWILGDSGTKNDAARSVRDAYYNYTGSRHTDLWLMLGDNAYSNGSDAEYQLAVFENMYEEMLRKSVLWPTLGNHDDNTVSIPGPYPYYNIFTLPKNGEAGGMASGTEAYYSFNYSNIHFICLNSATSSLREVGSPMWIWLEEDLAANDKDWTIAYWHHPPYSKGSHDSDSSGTLIKMRERALPLLEAGGVDLVISGHSHSYERSFMIDGHYGTSNTLTNDMIVDSGDGRNNGDGSYNKATLGSGTHEGAVYTVAGTSGKISQGSIDHPIMVTSLLELGSLVLDIDHNQLNAKFIDNTGNILDYFTLIKGTPPVLVEIKIFLEGPYDASGDTMRTDLRDNDFIPSTSPYAEDPRSISSPIPQNITDWVLVQLRETATGTAVASKSAFLRNDGRIVPDDGTSEQITFDVPQGDYYIVIKHSNHLAVMSADSIQLNSGSSTLYDFTSGTGQYYGSDAKQLEANVYGMYKGDANGNSFVNSADYLKLNAFVNSADYLNVKPNVGKNSQVP